MWGTSLRYPVFGCPFLQSAGTSSPTGAVREAFLRLFVDVPSHRSLDPPQNLQGSSTLDCPSITPGAEAESAGCPLEKRCSMAKKHANRESCGVQGPTVFARSPPAPQPVVVGPYMSIFELFYYLITSYHYLATVYCSLPPPPYAACVMPLRKHPLAAVCATAPGGWALGQGRKAHEAKQIHHYTSLRAPTG